MFTYHSAPIVNNEKKTVGFTILHTLIMFKILDFAGENMHKNDIEQIKLRKCPFKVS